MMQEEDTLILPLTEFKERMRDLRDDPQKAYTQLIDLTAVDYLYYGHSEWNTSENSGFSGFSRAASRLEEGETYAFVPTPERPERFAVVYHLLSMVHHRRIRVKVFVPETDLRIESLCDLWSCANWYEREVFDLFGIFFLHHPDLRRLLTDYGFIGHPFRKDFPVSGTVEVRYDPAQQRVVYEPVSIEPRVNIPRVIRPSAAKESDHASGA